MKALGHALIRCLCEGLESNLYNDNDLLEGYIFRYLWIPFVQKELDLYREQINSTIRKKSKLAILPNDRPDLIYVNPTNYGLMECGFPLEPDDVSLVDSLIKKYTVGTEALNLPEDFIEAAEIVYRNIGRPEIELSNIWFVFGTMKDYFLKSLE